MNNRFLFFFTEKPLKMLMLGFSSGLPILLVFSTLSVWLTKAGIEALSLYLVGLDLLMLLNFCGLHLLTKLVFLFFQIWGIEEVGYL